MSISHVARFAAVAVLAFEDHVVDDDAAADAGAEGEQHHAVRVAARADPELAVGGGVGVVLERGRLAERLLRCGSRTGTFFHGLRFGGSRMRPAWMSMRPGVATPMAAMSSIVSLAAATARRIVSHIVSRPASWPRSGCVSMTAGR